MSFPTRPFGRTGHHSTLAVLGGATYWEGDADSTRESFDAAIDAGINHIDIAPSYGRAEALAGPHIPAVRDKLFVACKTARRNAAGVRAQLEKSLGFLGCSYFDLYQAHGVISLADLDTRTDAFVAILAARDEGLCRFVGVTGHGPNTPVAQAEAVRRYDLDTVMFPINARLWGDADYRRDAEALLTLCAERNVGVLAIKSGALRPYGVDAPEGTWRVPWYEPIDDHDALATSIRFVLSVPGVTGICTPSRVDLTAAAIAAAAEFIPMDDDEFNATIAASMHEPVLGLPGADL